MKKQRACEIELANDRTVIGRTLSFPADTGNKSGVSLKPMETKDIGTEPAMKRLKALVEKSMTDAERQRTFEHLEMLALC
jgi:hypothetical protein